MDSNPRPLPVTPNLHAQRRLALESHLPQLGLTFLVASFATAAAAASPAFATPGTAHASRTATSLPSPSWHTISRAVSVMCAVTALLCLQAPVRLPGSNRSDLTPNACYR